MRVIAQWLKRHPSTLYRKIKRNWFHERSRDAVAPFMKPPTRWRTAGELA
jgi:IS30 family transposase